MELKVSVRQRSRPAVRILKVAVTTVAIVLTLAGSALAQGRLPFIGTRTFCGEFEGTTAIVSIRKDGFTTIKTNISALDAKAPYETFSGMLNAKGILRRGKIELTIKSETEIELYDYRVNEIVVDGKFCTSSTVILEKNNGVRRTPAASPNAGLPFIGTRTFCGNIPVLDDVGREIKKVETKTFVTIRKDGFTTVKSNISSGVYRGERPRYFTVSGKLDRKLVLDLGNGYFAFTSPTSIKIDTEDAIGEGKLCTSDEALPKKRNHAQRTPAVLPTAPVQTAEQGLMKISFSRLKSRDIARLYPALKGAVLTKREVSDDYDLPAFPPTASIAEVRNKAANLNLVFLYDLWCSKQSGCGFQIYADEGRGYTQVGGGSAKGPFFLLKDRGKTSVVYCGTNLNEFEGLGIMSFENHNFRFKGPYTGKDVPTCN